MKRKPTFAPFLGSISDGTVRTADLIPTFADELRFLLKNCRVDRETRKAHVQLANEADALEYFDTDDAECTLEELFEALTEYAPPYTYFGAHDDDGACYGFWPLDIDDQVGAGYIVKVDAHAMSSYREFWGEGDVYFVSDHGNVQCGRFDKRGRWHEYWSCV